MQKMPFLDVFGGRITIGFDMVEFGLCGACGVHFEEKPMLLCIRWEYAELRAFKLTAQVFRDRKRRLFIYSTETFVVLSYPLNYM